MLLIAENILFQYNGSIKAWVKIGLVRSRWVYGNGPLLMESYGSPCQLYVHRSPVTSLPVSIDGGPLVAGGVG